MKTLIRIMKLYRTATFLAGCLGLFILYAAPTLNLVIIGWLAVVPTFWVLLIAFHLFFITPVAEAWADLRQTAREYE